MALTSETNHNALWEVIWLGKKGLVRKDVGHDFGEGLRIYALLKSNGRKLVTLRCKNVGFPPPTRITQYPVMTRRIVTRRGKRHRIKEVTYVDRMIEYNERGIWWCPYCIQLRPFKLIKDWTGKQHMVCPICKINERNFHVRIHNPKAVVVEMTGRRRRAPRTRTNSRRRTR